MKTEIENFFVRSRYALKTATYFCLAYLNQSIANYLDRRLENKKRYWTAYGTFGAGVVPLGKVNMIEAIELTSRFGTVVKCDVEQAKTFFAERH